MKITDLKSYTVVGSSPVSEPTQQGGGGFLSNTANRIGQTFTNEAQKIKTGVQQSGADLSTAMQSGDRVGAAKAMGRGALRSLGGVGRAVISPLMAPIEEGLSRVNTQAIGSVAKQGLSLAQEFARSHPHLMHTLGSATEAAANGFSPMLAQGMKAVAPVAQQLGQDFGSGVSVIANRYEKIKQENPKLAQDIDDALGIANFIGIEAIPKDIAGGVTSLGRGVKNVATGAADMAGSAVGKVLPNRVALSDEIMNRVARISKGSRVKFQSTTGEDVGTFLRKRGIYGDTNQILEKLYTRFDQSKNQVDSAISQLPGTYKVPAVDTALDDLISRESRVSTEGAPSPDYAKLQEYTQKNKDNALTMTDINDIKRMYERNVKLDYLKENKSEGIARANNIDSAIREWQFKKADELGFSNLKDLNKETQGNKMLLNFLGKESTGSAANNALTLTDYILLSGGDPTAIGAFLAKKAVTSKKLGSYVAEKLAGKKGLLPEPSADLNVKPMLRLNAPTSETPMIVPNRGGTPYTGEAATGAVGGLRGRVAPKKKIGNSLGGFLGEKKPGMNPSESTMTTKGVSPLGEKIMATGEQKPTIKLKRNVSITTISGEKVTIPEDEVLKAWESGGKARLKDGREYVVSKNQYENIKANSLKSEAKEFAPELKQTEETVMGGAIKQSPRDKARKVLDDAGVTFEEGMPGTEGYILKNGEDVEYDELPANIQSALDTYIGSAETVRDIEPVATRYSNYQLPGGEGYKEILIKSPVQKNSVNVTLDELAQRKFGRKYNNLTFGERDIIRTDHERAISPTFKSTHWNEPNVLSHIRLNERTYNGKKVTFMEELQSDWAREGRKSGLIESNEKLDAESFILEKQIKSLTDKYPYASGKRPASVQAEIERLGDRMNEITDLKRTGIQSHPLLKNWQELSIKRALKDAVDNGSEYFAWINGEQTSARYNLATHVDTVEWGKSGTIADKKIYIKSKQGRDVVIRIEKDGTIRKSESAPHEWEGKKLDEVLGKGLADSIMSKESGTLSGEGLKFGGEWANNLYDKQVKNIIEKLTGKKVEMIDLGLGNGSKELENYQRDLKLLENEKDVVNKEGKILELKNKIKSITQKPVQQQAIKITPEIRAMVKGEALKLEPKKKPNNLPGFIGEKPKPKTGVKLYRSGEINSGNPAGVFFSENENIAKQYEGLSNKTTKEYTISPDSNIKHATTRESLLKELDPRFNEDSLRIKSDKEYWRARKEAKLSGDYSKANMTARQRFETEIEKRIADKLKGKYDGVRYDSGGVNDQQGEYQIFNKYIIKPK